MVRITAVLISTVMMSSLLFGLSLEMTPSPASEHLATPASTTRTTADVWATAGGGSGADMVWDMVLDDSGNSFVTGSFTGSATFGSTTLNSVGGLDGFVAKMDSSGNWIWASQIQGSYDDWGLGIDLDNQGNVYVTGPFIDAQGVNSPSVSLGSTTLSAHTQSTYDVFVSKLDGSGSFLWAASSKKITLLDQTTWSYEEQMGQVMPTDIKVFNNSISLSGSYNGKLWAYTDSQGDWYYESTSGTSDVWLGFMDLTGTWTSTAAWGGTSQQDTAQAIAPAPSGNYWYVAGTFQGSVDFPNGNTLSSSGGSQDVWVMQVTDGGSVNWVTSAGGTDTDMVRDIVADSQDSVYAIGEFDGVLASYGNDRLTANSGGKDVWAGKLSSGGSWVWAKKGGGASEDMGFSLSLSADESTVFTAGQIAGQTTFENTATTRMANTSGASDAFVAVSSAMNGDWEDVFVAGGPSGGDRAWAISTDSQNVTYTAGRFKGTQSGPAEFGSDDIVSAGDYDAFVWKGLIEDDDDDRIANEDDDCPDVWGNATVSPYIGCPDADGDGYADVDDSHPAEPTQWRDTDGDDFGDNPDGFQADNCTTVFGNSTIDRIGCVDSDGDGWSDARDAFPTEPTQWNDSDGDNFGDNWDDDELTANFGTLGLGQFVPAAVNMDWCPTMPGLDTFDNPGCPDSDYDGWSDVTDDFINNPTQHKDTDGDGWGDNHSAGSTQSDYLPYDETQHLDRDGDGWGDDPDGNNPDAFPEDETQQTDIDDDGWGDNISGNEPDGCVDTWGDSWRDRLGCPDVDGDGSSDEGDAFPADWSQWQDSDADGLGDNWANPHWNDSRMPHWPGEFIPGATNSDRRPLDWDDDGWEDENASGAEPWDDCPEQVGDSWQDRFGCPDRDGDGWSDEYDVFEDDPTQWRDSDRDGFGDEAGGQNGDDCPSVRGDSEHDRVGCPDTDGDGWSDPMDNLAPNPWNDSDGADLFPADPARWNETHLIKESASGGGTGGLAAGLGLGALIALLFAMVLAIIVLKLRGGDYEDEYDDDEDEDEESQSGVSRAAQIAKSWQQHGTAPPPAPEGAALVTTTSTIAPLQQPNISLPRPHPPISPAHPAAADTLATLGGLSGGQSGADSSPATNNSPAGISEILSPPSDPLQSASDSLMGAMDTSLAMSLLGGTEGGAVGQSESSAGTEAEIESESPPDSQIVGPEDIEAEDDGTDNSHTTVTEPRGDGATESPTRDSVDDNNQKNEENQNAGQVSKQTPTDIWDDDDDPWE